MSAHLGAGPYEEGHLELIDLLVRAHRKGIAQICVARVLCLLWAQ